jgi:hypothetical protein
MVRTVLTIVFSCTLGVGGTLLSQRLQVHTQVAVECPKIAPALEPDRLCLSPGLDSLVACPKIAPALEPGPDAAAVRPLDTTYPSQGRLLPMPALRKE